MKILKSKLLICLLLIAIVVIICVTFSYRNDWGRWSWIDIFFFFMAAFSQLMSLITKRMSAIASSKLSLFALIFFLLAIVSLFIESIVWLT